MKQRQRKQKVAGIRKASMDKKKPQPIKVFTLQESIADAEREVGRRAEWVAGDTNNEARSYRKFLLALLFYILLSISAFASPRTDTETKLWIFAGLSCMMFLPASNWLGDRSKRKRWAVYLQESVEHLQQLRS